MDVDDSSDTSDSHSSTTFSEGSSEKFILVQLPSVLSDMFSNQEEEKRVTVKKEIKTEPLGSPTSNVSCELKSIILRFSLAG